MPDSVDTLEKNIYELRKEVSELRRELNAASVTVSKFKVVMEGDASIGLLGMFSRMDSTNDRLKKLEEIEKSRTLMIRGLAIGMGLSSIAGISTVINLLSAFFGGGPT